MIPLNLAVEDDLSECVLRKLLADVNRGFQIGATYKRGGFDYLRQRIRGWNAAARGRPIVILTDLDHHECPPSLLRDWLGGNPHPNLIFKVAVREVESWVLADRENLARFLQVPERIIPDKPDMLNDPKRTLIEVARRSRSTEIRTSIVPRLGSTARQGPDYNGCLGRFFIQSWRPRSACVASPSLERTLQRLSAFKPIWTP